MDVLLIENDRATRNVLLSLLEERGHRVLVLEEPGEAEEVLSSRPFPLVFLDLTLPDGGCERLCRRIRKVPSGARSVIVVLVSGDRAAELKSAFKAGADDYITKPINEELSAIRLQIAERNASVTDVLSVLNLLRVGVAITDAEGKFTFISKTCEFMLGRSMEEVVGHRWEAISPMGLDEFSRTKMRDMTRLPQAERSRVPLSLQAPNGQQYSVEIDVHDEPNDPKKKIFIIYDRSEVQDLRRLLQEKVQFRDLIGRSSQMQRVFEQIRRIATVDSTVLVEGETGTGKELVARAIHSESRRRDMPFIAVNCGGLTESLLASQLFGHKRGAFTGAISDQDGVFEAAEGGTLFLDEIGDIPMSVQTSLLRVLQEREITRLGDSIPRKVDVRIIAATHHNLDRDVAQGSFRQDLLYRIRVARIGLPPLRDRRPDIPSLASFFLEQWNLETGQTLTDISKGALRTLMEYGWPGNVRELKSAIEFAAIHCHSKTIHVNDLPPDVAQIEKPRPPESERPVEMTSSDEEEVIIEALKKCRGNRAEAARLLGIGRSTLYRRLSELGISGKTSLRKPVSGSR